MWSASPNKDLHVMRDEARFELGDSPDDSLECRRDIREVGNAASNDQDLAIRARLPACNQFNCPRNQLTEGLDI